MRFFRTARATTPAPLTAVERAVEAARSTGNRAVPFLPDRHRAALAWTGTELEPFTDLGALLGVRLSGYAEYHAFARYADSMAYMDYSKVTEAFAAAEAAGTPLLDVRAEVKAAVEESLDTFTTVLRAAMNRAENELRARALALAVGEVVHVTVSRDETDPIFGAEVTVNVVTDAVVVSVSRNFSGLMVNSYRADDYLQPGELRPRDTETVYSLFGGNAVWQDDRLSVSGFDRTHVVELPADLVGAVFGSLAAAGKAQANAS